MNNVDRISRNEQIVRDLYDCIQQNRSASFEAIVAPTHVDRSNGRNGPAGFAGAAQNLHGAYSDFRIEIKALVASGDMVVVQWFETGIHTGRFFNLEPTNRRFESTGLNMYRIQDGQIVESWIAIDPGTIRAQQAAQNALQRSR